MSEAFKIVADGGPFFTTGEAPLKVQLFVMLVFASLVGGSARAADEARIEACKAAMNARIQVCTDDCTRTALAAASDYKDVNNNVKFGCMKGCALRQVFQMQVCRDGGRAGGGSDPTETNR